MKAVIPFFLMFLCRYEQEEEKSQIEDNAGPPASYDEVEISNTAFPELFPTIEFTKKVLSA